MIELGIYFGLFVAAFTAASLLPGQSEAVLVGLLLTGRNPVALLAVASAGNILGSILNWCVGRGIERFRHRRWFPASEDALTRSRRWYARYGKWSLLLSWLPVVGDPITLAAGIMREPLPTFVLLVSFAKIGRYLVLAALTLSFA